MEMIVVGGRNIYLPINVSYLSIHICIHEEEEVAHKSRRIDLI